MQDFAVTVATMATLSLLKLTSAQGNIVYMSLYLKVSSDLQ